MLRRTLVVALFLTVLAAPARSDVDVEIPNGAAVRGTLSAGEVETFRVAIPAGSRLTVTVKGKKSKGSPAPRVTFDIVDETDAVVPGTTPVEKGLGARLKKAELPASAVYRIRISAIGDDTGGYQANVKWRPVTRGTVALVLGAGEQTVPFAVQAGSLVTFLAKAAKGSAALPRLQTVDLVGADQVHAFAPPSKSAARKHTAKKVPLADFGDHTLAVGDAGGGGKVVVKFKLTPPKTAKAKLDLTDAAIGDTGGSGSARGGVVGPQGGEIRLGEESGLRGVGIVVPAGAVKRVTAIVVTTGDDVDPDDGQRGVGPAVSFGPAGQRFAADVAIVLPYEPDRVDGSGDDVRVALRSGGKVSLVPMGDVVVDAPGRRVTVSTDHFSTYQVVARRRPPVKSDLNGDGTGDVVVSTSGNRTSNGDVVHVWFGGAGLASGDWDTADVAFTPEGGVENQRFGSSVATGDLNGDGVEDLAISAWQATLQGSPLDVNGRIYVFFGGPGFTGSADPANDADVVLAGTGGERLGKAIAIADVTGDSTPDLVATTEGKLSGNIHSRVYAFAGGAGFASGTTADARLSFEAPDTIGLAQSIAVGNMLGDSKADIAVGTPFRGTGEVHIFEGRAEAFSGGFDASYHVLRGATGVTEFGRELGAGDLNDDGLADLVVSGIASPAQVWVFEGGTGDRHEGTSDEADWVFVDNSAESSDRFGQTFAIGDVTGDRVPELLIGDEMGGFDDGSMFVTEEGAIFGFLGGSAFASSGSVLAPIDLRGVGAADFFGEFLFVVDVTGDGVGDVLAGARRADDNGTDSGSLYVLGGDGRLVGIPDAADATITLTGASEDDGFTWQERF